MKNKLIILAATAPYLIFAQSAFADSISPCDNAQGISQVLCKFTGSNMGNIIGGILNVMFIIAIIFTLIYLVWGGLRWILSEVDKTKVAEARSHILAAVIGLIVVFLSYFIITLILSVFGLSLSSLKISPITP